MYARIYCTFIEHAYRNINYKQVWVNLANTFAQAANCFGVKAIIASYWILCKPVIKKPRCALTSPTVLAAYRFPVKWNMCKKNRCLRKFCWFTKSEWKFHRLIEVHTKLVRHHKKARTKMLFFKIYFLLSSLHVKTQDNYHTTKKVRKKEVKPSEFVENKIKRQIERKKNVR